MPAPDGPPPARAREGQEIPDPDPSRATASRERRGGARDLDPDRIARAAAGDGAELEQLLRAVEAEPRAGIAIPPRWRRSLEPNDVLQVSFLEAFPRLASLNHPSPAGFRAWTRRLVRDNLTDAIRALERDKRPDARRRVTHASGGESARTLFAAVTADGATPTPLLSAREQVARLHAAIERPPETYRRVVRQVDLAERSVAEVAAELGRGPGRIHMVRSRAHPHLGELLAESLGGMCRFGDEAGGRRAPWPWNKRK